MILTIARQDDQQVHLDFYQLQVFLTYWTISNMLNVLLCLLLRKQYSILISDKSNNLSFKSISTILVSRFMMNLRHLSYFNENCTFSSFLHSFYQDFSLNIYESDHPTCNIKHKDVLNASEAFVVTSGMFIVNISSIILLIDQDLQRKFTIVWMVLIW